MGSFPNKRVIAQVQTPPESHKHSVLCIIRPKISYQTHQSCYSLEVCVIKCHYTGTV